MPRLALRKLLSPAFVLRALLRNSETGKFADFE
jgi:hypothetical protein